ncbi:acyltransferase family protein [Ferrimonas balearica]|uniref:acyltransferase family protein n=1 Tax=Ferrimonas balearica TaxID=44012 RepID=UPI001C9979DC|nr:acyltransferase family protein [Ferrimonas balearica]MBY5991823.1 acyltransferase family protein [Ferrimonas balearica]
MSEHIAALRLLLIGGLVFVHYGPLPGSQTNPFRGVADLSNALPETLNSATLYLFFSAVPLLSILSGYLFFHSRTQSISQRLKRRARTIALPSLLWLLLWLLLARLFAELFPTALASVSHYWTSGAGVQAALTATQWPGLPWPEGFRALVRWLNATTAHPMVVQFWFIHDLLLTLLATPLIRPLLSRWPRLMLAALTLFWLSGLNPPLLFNFQVPFFFACGAALALHPDLARPLPGPLWAWALAMAVLVLGRVWLPAWQTPVGSMPLEHQWECLVRLCGVGLFHRTVQAWPPQGFKRHLVRWSPAAFFLFAFHYPTVRVLKWLTDAWVAGPIGQVVHWLAVPLATIALGLALAALLSRHWPRGFAWLNGQRTLAARPSRNPNTVNAVEGQ